MKFYIIAGEASGDLHASNLMHALKPLFPSAEFRCWGGDLMQQEGGEIVKHYRDLAFMGFTEVLMNLRTIFRNLAFCKQDIESYHPDVLILVDYPGFNLRIAEFAKQRGYKVIYYISPQVWAWKESRVQKIKKTVDKMLVILPFEKAFYKKYHYEVEFIGHPLLDAVEERRKNSCPGDVWKKEHHLPPDKPLVAILPGSRKQEISRMLPVMAHMADLFTDHTFVIAGAPSVPPEYYQAFTGNATIPVIEGKTYELLMHARAALVTSGTATLETALFGVPEVVCYKGGRLSYMIAKQLVNVDYISLVNLVMEKEVVKELIQDDFTAARLEKELQRILYDEPAIAQIKSMYLELKIRLGEQGASQRAAKSIKNYLSHT